MGIIKFHTMKFVLLSILFLGLIIQGILTDNYPYPNNCSTFDCNAIIHCDNGIIGRCVKAPHKHYHTAPCLCDGKGEGIVTVLPFPDKCSTLDCDAIIDCDLRIIGQCKPKSQALRNCARGATTLLLEFVNVMTLKINEGINGNSLD